MAKKKKDTKKVPKPKKRKPMDSAGWGVFAILFLVLLVPGMYVGWLMRSEAADPGAPIVGGGLLTLLVAGIITWILNMILQNLAARRRDKAK